MLATESVSHCRLHIQEIYKATRFNIEKDIWRLLHPKHFVNALMIHHSDHSREKDFFYVAAVMNHGLSLNKSGLLANEYNDDGLIGEYLQPLVKSDGSLKTTNTNAISEIFKPFKNNDGSTTIPKYILIEGAPGMGKTTLCKEIAYQWATNFILKENKLLFLIYLHDPNITNINNFKDLVHYQYDFVEENTKSSEQCAKDLTDSDGIDLTIVFDGYDEYNNSSYSIITKILNRKVLPKCRIIVTSRPTAYDKLHDLADVRVSLMGFTDDSKTQYIKQELMDSPDKIKKLLSYLNTHTAIKSICYMPMMMTILVRIFKQKKYVLPSNLTELYDSFIALTMCHHLQKHNISGDVFVTLENFPMEYKAVLTDLSKFAFLTLQNKQKVFSKEDIKNLCPNSSLTSSNLEILGIINSVKYICIDKGDTHLFSFLHLSIHQYLAAYHLNSNDQCEQFKQLETTFLNEMYRETWNMFVAMNKKATWLNVKNYFIYYKNTYHESLSQWISNIKSSFIESFVELYNILNCYTISQEVVQVLFHFQCSNNATNHDAHQEQMYISLCDARNVHKTKLQLFVIDKDLNSNWYKLFKNLSEFSMVFCKNRALILSKTNHEQIVDFFKHNASLTHMVLIDCHIADNTVDAIKVSCLQNLLHLQISRCSIECNAFVKLTNFLSSISNLISIIVNQGSKWSSEWTKLVCSVIVRNCNLQLLNLSNNYLQSVVIEIAKSLKHTKTLKVLNLSESNIPESAATAISAIINSNTSLTAFYIGNNNLRSSMLIILKYLNKISFLEVLDLRNNQIPEEAIETIASVVLHNPRLKELYLSGNNLSIGTLKVAKSLQHNTTLRVLSLGNNDIPQEASVELALAIKSNKQLQKLWLNDNNLNSSANVILNTLTTITTLTVLNLNNNQIPQEAGEALASVIMHNSRLKTLCLNGNNLGVGTLQIAKALQCIATLTILALGNNNIPKEACDELALAIKSNKQLKVLLLHSTNLDCSAIVILNSLITITTLTTLNLDNNQLSQEAGEALASVIMHNTRLEELYLDSNHLGIETVKVAKSLQHITTLKMLNLNSNNIPQEASDELALAIESNQLLKKLRISDNNLHSSAIVVLNSLAGITTLTVLDLNNNQIFPEANEALASVIMHNTSLEELYLNGNNLGTGTVKVAKSLQHITTLRVLSLDNNNIPPEASEELALVIQSNKQLEKLWLNDNNLHYSANVILKSLTTITTLTVLGLNNNQLPQEAGEALASIIMHNTRLETLCLNGNNLGVGTLLIAKALQCITTLTILALGNNNIPKEACDELALAIKSNKQLRKLSMHSNNLDCSANVILNSLITVTTLTALNLDNNQLTQEAGEALASVIMHNTRLEELYLDSNNLGVETVKVAKSLQHITTLKMLSLNSNNIPQEASNELALAIESNQLLRKLRISNNNLHYSAIVVLNSLADITTLTILDLNNNQITQEAGEALASVIMHNTRLEELYLHSNNLGIGTVKVAKSLQHITTLRVLSLDNNNIPQEASEELALAIKSNEQLEKLSLNNNNLHSSTIFILNSLSTITTLTVLGLNNNQIPQEAGEALASVIKHNTRLGTLCLNDNNLGVGTLKIVKALQCITTITILGLGNNNIPKEACDELALAIKSNKHLESFWLHSNNLHCSANVILNSLATITTLTALNLDDNQLTQEAGETLASVIMHNTSLEELYLNCNNLGIATVKVAKSLQHITTLRVLSLDNNNIPQEASEELALVIQSNKQLEKLWLNDNNLHSSAIVFLNSLATITTLTVLGFSNNQISQEAGEALASVIMHNASLEELYLDGNNLGIATVKVAKSLQRITMLRVLSLDNNNIPQEASEELALVIQSNKQLQKLWLNDNNLNSSANVILNTLTTITTLTVLNLNNNQIPQEAGEALASVIMHNSRLETLCLNGNNLGVGTLQIAKALQCITTLTILALGNNNIPNEACDELALAIKSNKQLKVLLLHSNNLDCSANVILNSLITVTTLTTVNLDNNQLSQEAGEALASVIMHNTRLEQLYLDSNNLGVETVKVAKSLQHITTLKMLSLNSNNIPQEASDELALAIESNQLLKKLRISDNNLHSSAVVVLNSLAGITTLTVLDLNNNQIPQEAREALASVIMHNSRLETLCLNGNNLGVGTLQIAKALQCIATLTILALGNNNIPKEGCDELALAIKSNKQLKVLLLHSNNLDCSAIVILNSLITITTLTTLNLDNNQLSQEAGEALASVIMHNTRLEQLYLDSNNLGIGTVKVAKSLQHITTLKMLSLNSNNIPQEASNELALAIKSNQLLKKLRISNNNLHSSTHVILNSLASITTLAVLDLNNNQIPQEAGEALAYVIMHNTRLEELYLGGNNLGIGIVKVVKSLQHITTLRVLYMDNNNIPQEACNEVALAIKSNIYFKELYLDNNCLHSSLVLILQALQCFSNLSVICIYGNPVTEEAGNLLASVISRNVKLQMLTLNLLIAPLEVIDAIQNLSSLQTLVFCTCKMSEQIEIKLASVITKNKSLTWLSLPNIILSQHVALQAIATLSNLTTLWLEDNLLLEQMSNDLSLAISSNKSLETVILLDNMLQTGLIEIVKACNKLSNLKVLQLAHNCIIPSKVVELTSIITQNVLLERVLLGGITLNAAERFHININEVLHRTDMTRYYNNTCCVTSIHCVSLEVIYLEMLRKQIDNTTKCLNDAPICLNSKNFWFAQKIYHYFEHASITQLKIQEVKCKLAQVDAKKIIYSLCIIEKVKVIDLENNNIDEDASFELATTLHSNNVLEQLWLRGNKLNTAGALYILNSLEYLTTLQVLDLSYNNIGSDSAAADGIAAVIDNNPLMNQLWLDGNGLYSTGTIVICNALKKIRTLSILSLCNNGITDDAADELSAVITHNILLEDLLLSNNQLQYTGITIISESLRKLIKLRKLDLFNNNISRQGANSLTIVLQNSTSLQDLFLSGNNLETSGALEICNALSYINSLHVLTLSNNNISDEVTSQLIEVLNNNHLYALLIGGNGLECGALKIAQVIENDNIAMQLLDFSNNNISEQDKEKIKVVFLKRKNFQFYV